MAAIPETPPDHRPPHAAPESPAAIDHPPGWRRWVPHPAAGQWAPFREDHPPDRTCWEHLPHDHARSLVYRWREDRFLIIGDAQGLLRFGLAV